MTVKQTSAQRTERHATYTLYSSTPVVIWKKQSESDLITGWSSVNRTSSNSPRVNGRLMRRSNTLNSRVERGTTSLNFVNAPSIRTVKSVILMSNATPPDLIQAAALAHAEKVKDMKINVAQALAEATQTTHLIADTARKLARSMLFLRQGRLHDAAFALSFSVPPKRFKGNFHHSKDGLSDAWLSLQYGWKPLLQDVYGAAETLARETPKTFVTRTRVKGVRSEQGKTDQSQWSEWYATWASEVERTVVLRSECQVTSAILGSSKKIGLTNPMLLAWELLPYSFVADWFVPIGSWLSSIDAYVGLSVKDGSTTTTDKWKNSATVYPNSARNLVYPGWSTYCTTANQRAVIVQKTRTLTLPQVVRFPPFKNPLTATHALSALALLNAAFSRR